ncbi:ABC transporter ATP-binding protein [Halococcus sp. IIIV-5B]|uniref:ABC transporter ATP-binding protein n=1 Tax=Halococcus sp. IIIV-5B TaxID=2321230 RepID=UPI000E7464E2|nr:ABC transporter ATP-binding protein [Halococcus sp. IIIV-5B]RJT07436.1 ABC transporter ATP-binding protein [Halococcus sp. IIIV-5B]
MSAIDLTNVTKAYGEVTAVEKLNLVVEEGEIYGFLGPNGAGKSTTIKMLLDFVRPTDGEVQVLGLDSQHEILQIRQRIGVLPEGFSVYNRLTGRQHLKFAIESKKANDNPDQLAERVGIPDAIDRKAGGYSKGMAQRLVLGMALVGDPDLLILDEPSTGLDPAGAREIRNIIQEENDRGATVFFSSHILGQIEPICDRVGILQERKLVAEDSIEELQRATGAEETLVITVDKLPNDTSEYLNDISGVSSVSVDETTVRVSCTSGSETTILRALEESDTKVVNFTTEGTSLEDLFIEYTTGRRQTESETPMTTGSDTEVER